MYSTALVLMSCIIVNSKVYSTVYVVMNNTGVHNSVQYTFGDNEQYNN